MKSYVTGVSLDSSLSKCLSCQSKFADPRGEIKNTGVHILYNMLIILVEF